MPGRKFHFVLNDKPGKGGAWEVSLDPMSEMALADAKYEKWVADRRATVDKQSGGTIGYLHIKAMDAPSLRQFTLELAMNRTKKALIIDQRFNGGGGIDQELLGILVGQLYQYTRGRDMEQDVPRPLETFYGPMIVMQNERSASDAEMFPQGFKDLKLGRVLGVPTMGAVIATALTAWPTAPASARPAPASGPPKARTWRILASSRTFSSTTRRRIFTKAATPSWIRRLNYLRRTSPLGRRREFEAAGRRRGATPEPAGARSAVMP